MTGSNDTLLQSVWAAAIGPALALMQPRFYTPNAVHLLLAIGLQESGLCERCQIIDGGGKGPARGLWQFERAGGVVGVLTHPLTRTHAWDVCRERGVAATSQDVWSRLESDDVLAAAFARLLLWTDGKPLPERNDADGGWALYAKRLWRPGKPHPERWPANFARAGRFVYGS